MNQKDIEALHEQASSHYLEGNLEAALSAWRRLLDANPDDDRAREGVELCERMSGCESESVVTEGRSPFAVGGMEEAETPAAEEEAPEPEPIEDPLDRLLDLGPPVPGAPLESPERDAQSDGGDGGELDLSDLRDESENLPSKGFSFEDLFPDAAPPQAKTAEELRGADSPPPPESGSPENEWHFGEGPPEPEPEPEPEPTWPGPVPDPPMAEEFTAPEDEPAPVDRAQPEGAAGASTAPEAGGGADEPAAASLHRRAGDLLATALEEMERGETTAALHTLERLLILDDQNFAARSLTQKLRAEIEAGETGPPAEATADATADAEVPGPEGMEGLELEVDDSLTMDPGGTDDDGTASAAEIDLAPEPLEPESIGEAMSVPAGGDGAGSDEPVPVAAAPGRRFSLPSRKIWIPVAAVLVLGAGFLAWSLFFGGGVESDPTEVPTRKAGAGKSRPAAGSSTDKPPVVADGGGEAAPPEKTVEEQVTEAIERAESALAEADYAAAVVAFNEALALDSSNVEIRKRLDDAGASYRVQQEKQARWNQAVRDFDQGDFQAALSYFYRLPAEEQTKQVERYKLNGWYNLGVLALKNRNCEEAGSHFREAREFAPSDPGIDEAMELVRRCSREGASELLAAISGLAYRGVGESPVGPPGAISGGSGGGP